jgi:hypothetical protein
VTALWTGGSLPPEYIDLLLMRDVFHCTPSELYEQSAEDIALVLALLEAEDVVRRLRKEGRLDGDGR